MGLVCWGSGDFHGGGGLTGILIFGTEKFGNDPHWVRMFQEIGWGRWFRYAAGVVEVLRAVPVMVPRVTRAGMGLLAAPMAAAVGILAVVLHRPGDAFYPGAFLVGVVGVGIWWWRRNG